MKKDSKLSGALHILLHLAEVDEPVTSENLAQMMMTNAVVVRRFLSGLRARGIVSSTKGHGGGWYLTCDLNKTTLRDVYDALGSPSCISLSHRNENTSCLVEQAVNAALGDAFAQAEALLLSSFEQVSLAALSTDFHGRYEQLKRAGGLDRHE